MNLLFSYGTLQDLNVQVSVLGRAIKGTPDAIVGFRQDWVEIKDPDVLKASGETKHPIVSKSELSSDTVAGTVFALRDDDIERADAYEVDDYERTEVKLASGHTAWLYVKASP